MSGHNFSIRLDNFQENLVFVLHFEQDDGVDNFCTWLTQAADRYGSESGQEAAKELAGAVCSGRTVDKNSVVLRPEHLASLAVFLTAMFSTAYESDLQSEELLKAEDALVDKYRLLLTLYQDGANAQLGYAPQGYIS